MCASLQLLNTNLPQARFWKVIAGHLNVLLPRTSKSWSRQHQHTRRFFFFQLLAWVAPITYFGQAFKDYWPKLIKMAGSNSSHCLCYKVASNWSVFELNQVPPARWFAAAECHKIIWRWDFSRSHITSWGKWNLSLQFSNFEKKRKSVHILVYGPNWELCLSVGARCCFQTKQ